MNIVLVGLQGSGKGLMGKLLGEKYSIPHISVGEILREIEKQNTPLGRKIKSIIDKGMLLPDVIVNDIVKKRLSNADCKKGFILDGYPRTLNEAKFLDMIAELDFVIHLDIPFELIVKRVEIRKKQGVVRPDDSPETIKRRMKKYEEETAPLLEYYRPRDIVYKIDASKSANGVFNSIVSVLGE